MPTIFNKKAKPTPHVIRVDEEPLAPPALPREHQALPLDPRIKLDARIRAECVEIVDTNDLVVNDRNAKKHPERQIALLCANIEEFGFTTPLLVDERNKIIAGHARYAAAKRIGLTHLPVVRLDAPYASTKRALAISDNRLAELGSWDLEILSEEFSFLFNPQGVEISFDPRLTGFDTGEVDQIIVDDQNERERADAADKNIPLLEGPAVSLRGDQWECADHRVRCGDATKADDYHELNGHGAGGSQVSMPVWQAWIMRMVQDLRSGCPETFAILAAACGLEAVIEERKRRGEAEILEQIERLLEAARLWTV